MQIFNIIFFKSANLIIFILLINSFSNYIIQTLEKWPNSAEKYTDTYLLGTSFVLPYLFFNKKLLFAVKTHPNDKKNNTSYTRGQFQISSVMIVLETNPLINVCAHLISNVIKIIQISFYKW